MISLTQYTNKPSLAKFIRQVRFYTMDRLSPSMAFIFLKNRCYTQILLKKNVRILLAARRSQKTDVFGAFYVEALT